MRQAGRQSKDVQFFGTAILVHAMSDMGLPSDFEGKRLLLLRCGYVRELAAASYPHIDGGGGNFSYIAGGGSGGWRLI